MTHQSTRAGCYQLSSYSFRLSTPAYQWAGNERYHGSPRARNQLGIDWGCRLCHADGTVWDGLGQVGHASATRGYGAKHRPTITTERWRAPNQSRPMAPLTRANGQGGRVETWEGGRAHARHCRRRHHPPGGDDVTWHWHYPSPSISLAAATALAKSSIQIKEILLQYSNCKTNINDPLMMIIPAANRTS